MGQDISKTQIDRLGERLRSQPVEDADLQMLDQYRRSFVDAYEAVTHIIGQELGLAVSGRPAKSTTSIIEKLKRESLRLSQMQDIAGCRLVVAAVHGQDDAVQRLGHWFPEAAIVDRRRLPSHGYRAVHVIVPVSGKSIEIQIRTALQHLWAEISENLADKLGSSIKYGGGNPQISEGLANASQAVADFEMAEGRVAEAAGNMERLSVLQDLDRVREQCISSFRAIAGQLNAIIDLRKAGES